MFTIRDYDGLTPIDDLSATVRSDMDNIWKDIAKPPGSEGASFLDFFDIDFAPLPSKPLQTERFEQEVAALRNRYVLSLDPRTRICGLLLVAACVYSVWFNPLGKQIHRPRGSAIRLEPEACS